MTTLTRRPARQNVRRIAGIVLVLTFPASFYYFSPYLSVMGALEGTVTGSLLLFGLLFLSSLVTGRLFCAWLCPAGALMDLVATGRHTAANRQRLHWIKYLVWAPWLAVLAWLFFRHGPEVTVHIGYATDHGFSVSSLPSLLMYLGVAAVFFGLSAFLGRRAACHTVCWMAPFMILGRSLSTALRLPAWRLQANQSSCNGCQSCDRHCPMSLTLSALVRSRQADHVDCILCGECVDHCPRSSLRFRWAKPQRAELGDE